MNREELEKLGYSKEQIDAIMAMYGKATGDLTEQVEKLTNNVTALTAERDNLQTQVTTYGTQLADIKKDADSLPELQAKIETMETEQATSKAEFEAKEKELTEGFEMEKALYQKGSRNSAATLAVLNQDAPEGETLQAKIARIDALKAAEETSYLFQQAGEQEKVKITATNNANGDVPPVDPVDAIVAKYS